MAFKKITGAAKYYKYAECSPGQVLVDGIYLGPVKGKFGTDYEFRDQSGDLVVLNKSGHLTWLIEKYLSEKSRVRVLYEGTTTLTSGKFVGKECHRFSLEVDDGDGVIAPKADDAAPWEQVAASGDDEMRV